MVINTETRPTENSTVSKQLIMDKTFSKLQLDAEEKRLAEMYNYLYSDFVVDQAIPLAHYITPTSYEFSRTFPTRSGDISIASFPKSGTTWVLYVVLLITQQGKIPEGKSLKESYLWPEFDRSLFDMDEKQPQLPLPRLLKSHGPYSMAVGGEPEVNPCKFIYVARNPKDLVVSFFHFSQSFKRYKGPWAHFLKVFMNGKGVWGDWFNHINSWWQHRHDDNILFLWYEELQQDYDSQVHKIADFLGYPLSPELLVLIKDKTAFNEMRVNYLPDKNESTKFFRKGKVGSGTEEFTEAQSILFDVWCANRLKETGLELDIEPFIKKQSK